MFISTVRDAISGTNTVFDIGNPKIDRKDFYELIFPFSWICDCGKSFFHPEQKGKGSYDAAIYNRFYHECCVVSLCVVNFLRKK